MCAAVLLQGSDGGAREAKNARRRAVESGSGGAASWARQRRSSRGWASIRGSCRVSRFRGGGEGRCGGSQLRGLDQSARKSVSPLRG